MNLCQHEDGCDLEINRDGLCFKHKIKTVRMGATSFTQERRGEDITQGRGTAAYVRDFTEKRRAAGLHDLEPENKAAARFMPKTSIVDRKKDRERNNGL